MTEETTRTDGRNRSALAASLLGGIAGTAVMTTFRVPTARSLPPTAHFLSRWFGGSPEDYPLSALVLHLAYGTAAGAIFGRLAPHPERTTDEPEMVGLLAGTAYGVLLSAFGERVVLPVLVGMDLDTDESAVFHAGHIVYGLTLGVWTGSRATTDETGGTDEIEGADGTDGRN